MKALVILLNKHFARASLVAKFSLIVNIGLSYVIQGMRRAENELMNALIQCHTSKYEDLNLMILKLGVIKDQAESPAVKQEIKKIIEEGKKSLP